MSESWDYTADVVIVGFGGAGVCAALEARAAGADVLALDRFQGGGTTAVSGGVVYAGGGTEVQREAAISDSPAAMLDYLRQEVGDAVGEATLREFCEQSPEMIAWLRQHGVPFHSSVCDYKTSYPTDRHYLYLSGNEAAWPFRANGTPVPRGHRTHAAGISGRVFFTRLAEAARNNGVRLLEQTRAAELMTDDEGNVIGVGCRTLEGSSVLARGVHRAVYRGATKPGMYVPQLVDALQPVLGWLERSAVRPLRIRAKRGVVLAAGGFIGNPRMLDEHAPAFKGGLALGTQGDDGSGIALGESVGGTTDRMGNVSVWRFIGPPTAMLQGILVNASGRRFIDESSYAGTIGQRIVTDHAARAWLLVDRTILEKTRQDLAHQTQWFQRLLATHWLRPGQLSGNTVEDVAHRAGIDPAGLAATVATYGDQPDALGKSSELVVRLKPPFTLIDYAIQPSLMFPSPMFTLGGLVVDEQTGQVRRQDGSNIPGLYAAGRTAVGICSNSYVSGLSIADCVFSGRRAGKHAGRAARRGT